MGRAFVNVIFGGGVAAGYAALEFTRRGVSDGELCIISEEPALKLEKFGVEGSDAENVCYLRDLADANRLAAVIQSSSNGNAVVIRGGYIGMDCAASLVINIINVTMVFPGAHCMARLFTPKIASLYEDYYRVKGVKFIKGKFEFDLNGKVTAVNLKAGNQLPADFNTNV